MKHTVSLTQNHLFRRLYAKGKQWAAPSLAIYCQRNRHGGNRLGLTVGKKVGNAVVRNRVRRRIREAYRIHEHRIKPGYDIVVVARVKAAFLPYSKVEANLLATLDKLGLWKKDVDA